MRHVFTYLHMSSLLSLFRHLKRYPADFNFIKKDVLLCAIFSLKTDIRGEKEDRLAWNFCFCDPFREQAPNYHVLSGNTTLNAQMLSHDASDSKKRIKTKKQCWCRGHRRAPTSTSQDPGRDGVDPSAVPEGCFPLLSYRSPKPRALDFPSRAWRDQRRHMHRVGAGCDGVFARPAISFTFQCSHREVSPVSAAHLCSVLIQREGLAGQRGTLAIIFNVWATVVKD